MTLKWVKRVPKNIKILFDPFWLTVQLQNINEKLTGLQFPVHSHPNLT